MLPIGYYVKYDSAHRMLIVFWLYVCVIAKNTWNEKKNYELKNYLLCPLYSKIRNFLGVEYNNNVIYV